MNAIEGVFDEVQRSSQTHKMCVKKLAAALRPNGQNEHEHFLACVDEVLKHPGNASVERTVQFLGAFLSSADESLLDRAMTHICSRLPSAAKHSRARVCQIVRSTLDGLCQTNVELCEKLFNKLQTDLCTRLRDKTPSVRVAAVRALKCLQTSEEGDKAVVELTRLLSSDASAAVRAACAETLSLTDDSKHHLCARLKDVKAEVRAAVLRRLTEETDCRQFTAQMRAEILRSALEDREAVVDNSNVSKFLNLLNPAENEEAALLVGATILEELMK
ncbi:hypothetical protein B484DRAFT_435554, partial [Ochromonadaceae sp. CCMP2298]